MDEVQTAVAEAMAAEPRREFLPADVKGRAEEDAALPIGFGATNSQPTTVWMMLELLAVPRGARVLDVGSGSGWTTALLAHLTGPDGWVLGLEIVPELTAMGQQNLRARHLPWARIEQASRGVVGAPDQAPFDRILVSADADEVPAELEQQLAPGGRLVIPAGGLMWTIERDLDQWRRESLPGYRFAFVRLI